MIFSNDGIIKLYSSNSTSSAATLSPGITTGVATNGFSISTNGAMGVWLGFFGVGSNNNAGTFRVNGVSAIYVPGSGRPNPANFHRWHLGQGTFTLSSTLTGDGTIVPASNYLADGATYVLADTTTSPKGIGSLLETSYSLGNAAAFSPADDATNAWVFIPVQGFFDYIEVEALKGTATSVNVLAVVTGKV